MLTPLEQDLLAFEAIGWRDIEAHDTAARDLFGYTATRHAQVLGALLPRPEALAAQPQLVHRYQRLRAAGRSLYGPVVDSRQTRNRLRRTGP